jgi:hypothetical protein
MITFLVSFFQKPHFGSGFEKMVICFLLLAAEAIAEGLDLTSGDNEQFLKLNRHQCKYVAQKMSDSREVLQVLEPAVGYVVGCEAALKELYRVVTNALSLIKVCRFEPALKKDDPSEPSLSKDDHHESWLRAAITQRTYERSEDFVEICSDLQWCTSIIWISCLQSAATLQVAILVPEDCYARLGRCGSLQIAEGRQSRPRRFEVQLGVPKARPCL